MSTKIHNGYRLSPGTHPALFAAQVREALAPLARRQVDLTVVKAATWELDREAVAGVAAQDHPLYAAVREAKQRNDTEGWADASVVLLCDTEGDGRWYAMFYPAQITGLTEAFEALEGVESWGYWNNTDAPEDVTEQQWDQRREVWDRLLGWDAPSERGLVVEVLPTGPRIPMSGPDDLIDLVPDVQARARSLALMLVVNELAEGGMDAMQAVLSAGRPSGEHAELVRVRAAEIQNQLPEITRSVLLRGLGAAA